MSEARQMVRSSILLGGSSLVGVLGGLVRIKVAALLLGPVGVGLIGVLQSFMMTATTFASLGMGPAAARQVAVSKEAGDRAAVTCTVRSLILAVLVAALAAAALIALARAPLADLLMGPKADLWVLGWLALGVAAGLLSAAQISLLSGLGQTASVARIQIAGAVAATLLAPAALFLWGERGIGAYVIAGPLALALFGLLLGRSAAAGEGSAPSPGPSRAEAAKLLRLGIPLMLGGAAGMVAQLAARLLVGDELGAVELGLMQAGWLLPSIYAALVLQVLQLEFFPKISARWGDPSAVRTALDQQCRILLLLVGPPLIVGMTASDILIRLFFSEAFLSAAGILRWHIAADLVRFAAWPMAFLVLAAGRGRTFMLLETAAALLLVTLLWLLLPLLGLPATGLAVLVQTILYLALVSALAWRDLGPPLSRSTLALFLGLLAALGLAAAAPLLGDLVGLTVGALLSLVAGGFSYRTLRRLGALPFG